MQYRGRAHGTASSGRTDGPPLQCHEHCTSTASPVRLPTRSGRTGGSPMRGADAAGSPGPPGAEVYVFGSNPAATADVSVRYLVFSMVLYHTL